MKLDGATASIVRDLFGTTADNVAAASVAVVIGFLIWGISIGQLYQDVYARAWRIHVGSAADQLRYTIWFFVVSGILAVMFGSASELRASGWLVALPIWVGGSIVFWLWTPRFLLHREVSLRSLLPGALLATFVLSGTIATSPLWIGPTINQNAKAFGSFGAVIALFAYILIGTTLSMVCAVFAPVWAEWRQGERERERVAPADRRPVGLSRRQTSPACVAAVRAPIPPLSDRPATAAAHPAETGRATRRSLAPPGRLPAFRDRIRVPWVAAAGRALRPAPGGARAR